LSIGPYAAVRAGGFDRAHELGAVPVAITFGERLLGLIGKRDRDALCLLIPRCASVHTWFMRSPIDILFLDRRDRVLAVTERARAWRSYSGPRGTCTVLELPPGRAKEMGVRAGDYVWYDAPSRRSRFRR